MVYPDLNMIRKLSSRHNRIPVYRELNLSEVGLLSVVKAMAGAGDIIFLESARQNRKWSRFSFLGINPGRVIEFRPGRVTELSGGASRGVGDDIFSFLKEEIRKYSSPVYPRYGDFNGGLAGYFAYELVNHAGILRSAINEDDDLPLVSLLDIDDFIVHDNRGDRFHVATSMYPDDSAPVEEQYAKALEKLERLEALVLDCIRNTSLPFLPARPSDVSLRFGESRESFMGKVTKTRELISSGEAIQTVLSIRASIEDEIDPYSFYLKLRSVNPSPYMFFLKTGNLTVAGSSPEIHVKVERGRVYLKPIAGTVPQGSTRRENLENKAKLLGDEKERAEHLMLVDLARNDIARVSPNNPVKVESFMTPEDYSHVIHLVSLVSAELGKDRDVIDVLRETFPAGTVSGAPKVRAIEIIGEMENHPRGIYAGAVGYIGYNGFLDTCITIRTAVFSPRESYLQAGAGIVYDSVPEKEYEEILNKLKALTVSLQYAGKERKEAARVSNG